MRRQPEIHDDDRISALPEEIIYKIMELLNSPKQAAKAAVLSKRWIQLWRSYPILEFNCDDYPPDYELRLIFERFAAAAAKRVDSNSIQAVRIHVRDSSGGRISDHMIANRHLQEISLSCGYDYKLLPTQLFNCGWPRTLNHLDVFTNLRVLHLERLSIEGRLLNDLIACAPMVESLTLKYISYNSSYDSMMRLQVRNHPNLKLLKIYECDGLQSIEVVGAHSLETLSILNARRFADLRISPSSLPDLKSLELERCSNLAADVVSELISNSSSLRSLYVGFLPRMYELKIRSRTLEYFRLHGSSNCIPAVTHLANNLQDGQLCRFELLFNLDSVTAGMFTELQELLSKLNRQSHLIHLCFRVFESAVMDLPAGLQLEDELPNSPAPAVEHVTFEYYHWGWHRDTLLYNLFRRCRPKYMSFHFRDPSSMQRCSDVEVRTLSLRSVFSVMEAISRDGDRSGCRGWLRQLKDVKLVNTRNVESEELMDISTGAVSSKDETVFKLRWHLPL